MKSLIVNLFGGPGIGKSVIAAKLYAELSSKSICCELVGEYAKELVWQEKFDQLEDQIHVTSEQIKKMAPVGKCRCVIADSPVILGQVYANENYRPIIQVMIKQWEQKIRSHMVLNILLIRDRDNYGKEGRIQSKKQAIKKDQEIKDMLDSQEINYIKISNNIQVQELMKNIIPMIMLLEKNE